MTTPSHAGLFKIIRENCNHRSLAAARYYVKTSRRITVQKQHLNFNLRSKRYALIPNSIRVRPLVDSYEGHRIAERASRQFLAARVTQNHRAIRHLETDAYFQRLQLEFALQPSHFCALEKLVDRARSLEQTKCKERQKRKFDSLLSRSWNVRRNTPPDNWVVNLSSKQLTIPQKSVLARGLNFVPDPRKIPASRIVAAVEDALRWINQPDVNRVPTTVVGILNKARSPPMNLPPLESKALKNLQADDEIVIVPADKGRAAVVMDRLDYDSKTLYVVVRSIDLRTRS